MKIKHYVFFTIMALMVLGAISTVSAGPTETITSGQTIKSGIDLTDNGGTLIVSNGTYDKVGDRNNSIDKNITIKGQNNVTLDAKNQNRHFLINGSNINVKFENLIFKNGLVNDNNGGSVLVSGSNVNITFINCIFINNVANTISNTYCYGGAISGISTSYSNPSLYNNQLFVNDCEFINNTATIGGGINWFGGYYIYDTKFINGTGKATSNQGEGGGINVRSCSQYDNIIKGCLFDGNKITGSNQYGAAICDVYSYSGNMKIVDCIFINNDGRTILSLEGGNKNLTGNYFEKNNATTVVRIGTTTGNNAANVIVNSNVFTDNIFKGVYSQNQGLISLEGISSGKIYNNTLLNFPWAIYQGSGYVNVDVYNNTIRTDSGIHVNAVASGYNIYNNNIYTKNYGVYISGINSIENLTVNYNRFISESGYAIAINRDQYTNGSFDYNWYGNNSPNVNSLVKLNNWVIVDVVPITSLNGKIVNFTYVIKLSDDNVPFYVNKLPDFDGTGLASLGNSIVYDAKLNQILTLINNDLGTGAYNFVIDNQMFTFTDEVLSLDDEEIIPDEENETDEENGTNSNKDHSHDEKAKAIHKVDVIDKVDVVDKTSDIEDINDTEEDTSNVDDTKNNLVANAAMKNTGMHIIVVILVLLSMLGVCFTRK